MPVDQHTMARTIHLPDTLEEKLAAAWTSSQRVELSERSDDFLKKDHGGGLQRFPEAARLFFQLNLPWRS
jgi:hypothetical protein